MTHRQFKFSFGAALVAGSAALVVGAGATLPANSSSVVDTTTITQCSSGSACMSVRNSGAGQALAGVSVLSDGLSGRTKAFSAKPGAHAVIGGVLGEDVSVAPGGQENFSSGLVGTSQTGFGIMGFSKIHA